jgi:hypothetical protein
MDDKDNTATISTMRASVGEKTNDNVEDDFDPFDEMVATYRQQQAENLESPSAHLLKTRIRDEKFDDDDDDDMFEQFVTSTKTAVPSTEQPLASTAGTNKARNNDDEEMIDAEDALNELL